MAQCRICGTRTMNDRCPHCGSVVMSVLQHKQQERCQYEKKRIETYLKLEDWKNAAYYAKLLGSQYPEADEFYDLEFAALTENYSIVPQDSLRRDRLRELWKKMERLNGVSDRMRVYARQATHPEEKYETPDATIPGLIGFVLGIVFFVLVAVGVIPLAKILGMLLGSAILIGVAVWVLSAIFG